MVMRHINKELKLGFHRLMQLLCFISKTFLLCEENRKKTKSEESLLRCSSCCLESFKNKKKTSFKTNF